MKTWFFHHHKLLLFSVDFSCTSRSYTHWGQVRPMELLKPNQTKICTLSSLMLSLGRKAKTKVLHRHWSSFRIISYVWVGKVHWPSNDVDVRGSHTTPLPSPQPPFQFLKDPLFIPSMSPDSDLCSRAELLPAVATLERRTTSFCSHCLKMSLSGQFTSVL